MHGVMLIPRVWQAIWSVKFPPPLSEFDIETLRAKLKVVEAQRNYPLGSRPRDAPDVGQRKPSTLHSLLAAFYSVIFDTIAQMYNENRVMYKQSKDTVAALDR